MEGGQKNVDELEKTQPLGTLIRWLQFDFQLKLCCRGVQLEGGGVWTCIHPGRFSHGSPENTGPLEGGGKSSSSTPSNFRFHANLPGCICSFAFFGGKWLECFNESQRRHRLKTHFWKLRHGKRLPKKSIPKRLRAQLAHNPDPGPTKISMASQTACLWLINQPTPHRAGNHG